MAYQVDAHGAPSYILSSFFSYFFGTFLYRLPLLHSPLVEVHVVLFP
jgi:hypothetical protein